MSRVNRMISASALVASLAFGGVPSQGPRPALVHAQDRPELHMAGSNGWGGTSFDLSIFPYQNASLERGERMATHRSTLGPLDAEARVLRLYDVHERAVLKLAVNPNGSIADTDRGPMEHFFRCRRTQRTHTMSKGVLTILHAVDRAFPGHVIEIVSGFRTYPFGVQESKHYEGHAIDLRVRGVRTTRVRDFVWRHFADVGVGYYGHQNFVHVDYRPDEKDTAWTSPQPKAKYTYNPRWALRIRPPWRAPRELPGTQPQWTIARAVFPNAQSMPR